MGISNKKTGFLKEKSHLIFLKIFCLITSVFLFLLNPISVLAQTYGDLKAGGFGLKNTGTAVYGTAPSTNLPLMVGKIINAVLGLLGTIALVLIIYAGVLWMTAGGSEEQIKKAKGILTSSFIGLIIVIAAYAIASFIITALTKTATG